MFDKLGEILKFRVKILLISVAVVGIGFIGYKIMTSFVDRNQTSWETNLNVSVAELVVLADHQVEKASMGVEWNCGGFSLTGKESPSCGDAKKQLEAALRHKDDVEAKRGVTLSQAGQTQQFYNGVVESSKRKPFVILLVAMALSLLAGILYFILPSIQKALGREDDTCSEDGLP